MEHLDAIFVDVDVGEVVELLEHEVRRVVENVAGLVALHSLEKHLEGFAVEDVFTRMHFEAAVLPVGFENIEDGFPALCELIERGLDETRRPLRPRIQIGPGKSPGERCNVLEPQVLAGFGDVFHLLHGPGLARLRVAVHFGGSEVVELQVVGRVHRHELPLQVSRQLRGLDAVFGHRAADLIAIRLALGGLLEIHDAGVPARQLHADEAALLCPLGHVVEILQMRATARELRQKYRRSLDGFHALLGDWLE